TDAYMPVRAVLNGIPVTNRFYQFSHSIDMLDPTQLLVSGAAQYYTPDARPILQGWLDTISRFPQVADDESLDYTYNFAIPKNLVRASWWTEDYCRYPWWIHVRPIIDHPQFPEGNTRPNFRLVAGRERWNALGIQLGRPQGPFPRDCLIDTKEKSL